MASNDRPKHVARNLSPQSTQGILGAQSVIQSTKRQLSIDFKSTHLLSALLDSSGILEGNLCSGHYSVASENCLRSPVL